MFHGVSQLVSQFVGWSVSQLAVMCNYCSLLIIHPQCGDLLLIFTELNRVCLHSLTTCFTRCALFSVRS
jgi:hypothetical protein